MNWSGARSYRSREAWLAARRLGSSDAAAILGVSSMRGPWDVFLDLQGRAPKPESADQARGKRWEIRVLEDYAYETGRRVLLLPGWTMWTKPDRNWSTSTPDALAEDGGELGLVEAKTDRRSSRWGPSTEIERWETGAELVVRPDYALQCYHQLWVTGAPWVDLAVMLPTYELRVYRLWPDPSVERELAEQLGAWWERHIVGGIAPDPDESDACRAAAAERIAVAGLKRPPRPATKEEADLVLWLFHARRVHKANKAEDRRLTNLLASRLEPGDSGLDLRPHARGRAMWQRNHWRLYGMEST